MAQIKIILPKMGEGVAEATLISYLVQVGQTIEAEQAVAEVATDKVDSEVTSPQAGKIVELCFNADDVVKVGEALAILEVEGQDSTEEPSPTQKTPEKTPQPVAETKQDISAVQEAEPTRFYSPLVKNIAKVEGIPMSELEQIKGTGKDSRVTKDDILSYVASGKKQSTPTQIQTQPSAIPQAPKAEISSSDEVIPMGRMRKLIAGYMVASVHTSPHVTSVVETDITTVSRWRNRIKNDFAKREGEKLTYTPIFIWAVARALRDFPMVNVSVDGDNIIKHNSINIGMAVSLPSGDLIVPVIHNADKLSISGLARTVNDLAKRAREGKLLPTEIKGGTFTVTNIGSFGTLIGTPIINQPEVAILGLGAIQKTVGVIELNGEDMIAIREKMFLSLSYDHRVVDGSLGGMFVKRVSDYLEGWKDDFVY